MREADEDGCALFVIHCQFIYQRGNSFRCNGFKPAPGFQCEHEHAIFGFDRFHGGIQIDEIIVIEWKLIELHEHRGAVSERGIVVRRGDARPIQVDTQQTPSAGSRRFRYLTPAGLTQATTASKSSAQILINTPR